ncbi:TonB-dependent receptor [Thermomonas brevis]|uniref:TonB-dependent receptor n=1 Tax=Thermomonas brevis TaxID=215691 RepID=A0A7G9QSM9_9GAMM|nr:TonB-dependent receptor [Thermomonas brevis]QNN46354.1 TonB-dependent receptor [Thermomonas brevis]
MVQLKRNLLSVALATAAMMLAAQASAQDAQANPQDAPASAKKKDDAKNLDTVVVTGIRGGIERAIDIKKDATSIVEAVSAEDIGKLPDVSIAESIARLPGLAAQRVAGRAQVISVRGLSPDFATTLLNGRELVSTGDNRSVEFDQYPSELMAGVTVYKTPDAALVGQGLSGTMDMRTVRPLDYDKPVIALSGRWQRNSLGSAANEGATGNRFNASYIGQSADRTIGYSIGYSHSDTPIQENQVGLYEPWQAIGENWRPGVDAGTYYSDGIKALRRTGYTKRDGVMGTLEVRAKDGWISTLDVFHSQAKQESTANQFEVNLSGWNGGYDPGLNVDGAMANGNDTFTGGTVQNVYPLVRGMYNHRKDTISAVGWRNEFFMDNGVKLTADLSWSRAKRDELSLENNAQIAPPPALDSIDLSISEDGFSQMVPTLDYSDPSKLFLRNTIYGSGYGKVPKVEDELKGFRLDANFPASGGMDNLFSSIDVGLNYADRKKEKHQPEGNINVGSQGDTTIESDLQYGLVDLGFAGIGMIPSWNVPGAVSRYMTFVPSEDAAGYLIAKTWIVNETITTGYAKGNIDTTWGSVPVRGNIGLQIQHVDQSSDGRAFLPPNIVSPYTKGKTYTDVLPSMNLAFSLADDQTLRVGLARQVARPRVDQMRASLDFGVDENTGKPGGSSGNAMLDPWRANAFDISWEKYFGSKAYIAAAYFYKDLRSYIYTQSRDGYDYSAEVASYVPQEGKPPVQQFGTYSEPLNGKGGKLQGVELTASLPLDMVFGDALQGFGVVASASFNDSSIKILDPESASSVGSDPISLPGLSKRVYNLTAYYERNGFEFRVNNRRRSDFIGEIGNFDGNRTLRYVVGENITDAQVSYTFGESSAFKGLSLLLQASNLGDEAYRTYAGTKDRPLEYIKWGRTLLLGASYRF